MVALQEHTTGREADLPQGIILPKEDLIEDYLVEGKMMDMAGVNMTEGIRMEGWYLLIELVEPPECANLI